LRRWPDTWNGTGPPGQAHAARRARPRVYTRDCDCGERLGPLRRRWAETVVSRRHVPGRRDLERLTPASAPPLGELTAMRRWTTDHPVRRLRRERLRHDTWAFKGGQWSQILPTEYPPGAAISYRGRRGQGRFSSAGTDDQRANTCLAGPAPPWTPPLAPPNRRPCHRTGGRRAGCTTGGGPARR